MTKTKKIDRDIGQKITKSAIIKKNKKRDVKPTVVKKTKKRDVKLTVKKTSPTKTGKRKITGVSDLDNPVRDKVKYEKYLKQHEKKESSNRNTDDRNVGVNGNLSFFKKNDSLSTPNDFFMSLHEEFHFTFDPCPYRPDGVFPKEGLN